MQRRTFARALTGAVAGLLAPLSGCLDSGPVENTSSVQVSSEGFDPKNIHVEKEATVSWENPGDGTHVIASASSNWDFEAELGPGTLVHNQFYEAGVYKVVDKNNGSAADFTGTRMKIAVGDAEITDPVE